MQRTAREQAALRDRIARRAIELKVPNPLVQEDESEAILFLSIAADRVPEEEIDRSKAKIAKRTARISKEKR